MRALNVLDLQSQLIDNRPRYTLATTSRMLKNISVNEDDILEFKAKTFSPTVERTQRTSYMNRRNQMKPVIKAENIRAKSTISK